MAAHQSGELDVPNRNTQMTTFVHVDDVLRDDNCSVNSQFQLGMICSYYY